MDSPVAITNPPDSSSATPLVRRRQRARKACLPCRLRKRKCDMQRPCSMCKTYDYECQYAKDTRPSAAYIQQTSSGLSPGMRQPNGDNVDNDDHIRSESPVSRKTLHSYADSEGRDRRRSDGAMQKPKSIDRGILDPYNSRYMSQSSSVAFPRDLAVDLQSSTPLPLHSFAYHCSLRPEEPPNSHPSLSSIISHEECDVYLDIYYTAVHQVFGFLEHDHFLERYDNFWNGTSQSLQFSAVIAGVAALGSCFSTPTGHPRELDLLRYAKDVLEDPEICRRPSIDQVSAWILRTIYLRATTRPHVAWLASCITLHLAEATGLHHDIGAIVLTTDGTPGQSISSDERGLERARSVFWASWTVNMLTAYEYGRSSVKLDSITCKQVRPLPGNSFTNLVKIAQLIPPEGANCDKEELLKAIQAMKGVNDSCEMITLTKADFIFAFYRRLRLLRQGIEKEVISDIVSTGNKGVSAAYILAQQNRPWWNVLGTTFQYLCVLLAVDTSETLSHVPWVLETFEKIVELLGRPHLAVEALETARTLLRDSVKKKKQELSLLEIATSGIDNTAQVEDVGIDWDAVFNTYPPISLTQDYLLGGSAGVL
ncbi:hypothetical protein F5884DRAFT_489738 [Xylogone sp. PMI_703]|nr:hypothetical protein F5884DRAFT_489738 [Xylogone sp. PMI_703]